MRGPFLYEDAYHIGVHLTWIAWEAPRSFTFLTFWLTPRPFGAHVFNLGVHLLNGLVLYVLASRLMTSISAAFATGLFWLHPIQSEAVAYITGRGELLAATGILVALLGLFCVKRDGWASLVVLIGGSVAMSAKEATGIAVLLWMPLVALWLGRGTVIVPPMIAWTCLSSLYARALPMPFAPMAWMVRQSAVAWHLLRLMAWPMGQSFETPAPLWPWLALAGTVVVIGAAIHRPRWRLAGLWAAASLLPRIVLAQPLNLIPEPLHEHHCYALMLGVCLFGGVAWPR